MKTMFTLLALSFSLSSFAFINEVECTGRTIDGRNVRVEIERSLGGSVRDARVTIFGARGTNNEQTRHWIHSSRKIGTRIQYIGDLNFRLEVDTWPDQAPRWGRNYRGSFPNTTGLSCRYPNAR